MKFKLAVKECEIVCKNGWEMFCPAEVVWIKEAKRMQDKKFEKLLDNAVESGIKVNTIGVPYDFSIDAIPRFATMNCRLTKYDCESSVLKLRKFIKKYNLDANVIDGCVEITYNN